jgi:tripartite-type tricarboxylate transporter receptor subunit TctC
MNALLAGETQVAVYAVAAMAPHVKQGRAKALAVMGDRRHALMPAVPTLREAGIELELHNWTGIFMPAGTRREIVQRLNQEFGRLLADPAFREKIMVPAGLDPDEPNSPESFAAFLKRDREMYEKLVKATGLKGD